MEDLVAAGAFDVCSKRHRAALDRSEDPLADTVLEELRLRALYYRRPLRNDSKYGAAKALRQFAEAVSDQR